MGLIDSLVDATRFKDTVFYKVSCDLQTRYDALKKLSAEYPSNDKVQAELSIIKRGLDGENEIAYQLKKASIGMYVLRDVKVKYEDLAAQIDYVIITPAYTYYVECKNLVGNITVTERGDFIRELTISGKKVKKGIYSPLRQVEAQREVIRKIWDAKTSTLKKLIASKDFNHYRRVLVVAANQSTILNVNRAPKDMKYKVMRADSLVRQIEYDLKHRGSGEYSRSKRDMEEIAQWYIDLSVKDNTDYYEFYKKKFCGGSEVVGGEDLKKRLIEFRKSRAGELKIPLYYVFTNEELEQLVKTRPKTLAELEKSGVLAAIKTKTHGRQIVDIINK